MTLPIMERRVSEVVRIEVGKVRCCPLPPYIALVPIKGAAK